MELTNGSTTPTEEQRAPLAVRQATRKRVNSVNDDQAGRQRKIDYCQKTNLSICKVVGVVGQDELRDRFNDLFQNNAVLSAFIGGVTQSVSFLWTLLSTTVAHTRSSWPSPSLLLGQA